ncbi:hypothetical protein ACVIN2_002299 [Bradyrhizobium sp. USDA 3650]
MRVRSAARPSSRARSRVASPASGADALSRQSLGQARLGPCARLCRGHAQDPASRQARRFRARHGRDALGARDGRVVVRPNRLTHRVARRGRRRDRRRHQDRQEGREDRSDLFPPYRGRSPRRRRQQGARGARLNAEAELFRARRRDDGERSGGAKRARRVANVPFELQARASQAITAWSAARLRASTHHRGPARGRSPQGGRGSTGSGRRE